MESPLEAGIREALASVGLDKAHIDRTIALLYAQDWFSKAEASVRAGAAGSGSSGAPSGAGAASAPQAAAATDPVKKARLQELAAMPFPGGGTYGQLTRSDIIDILDDRSMYSSDADVKTIVTEMSTLLGDGYTVNSGGRRAQRRGRRGRRTVKRSNRSRRATRGTSRRGGRK